MTSNLRLIKSISIILVSLFLTASAMGATYSLIEVPQDIPDPGTLEATIDVPDSVVITDIDVEIQVLHGFISDITATIISPAGTEVVLASKLGGDGDNYKNTIFDDEAEIAVVDALAPFEGLHQPVGELATLDGEDAQGTWTLKVEDASKLDAGQLICCSLYISTAPVAMGRDITVSAGKGMVADVTAVDINCGSYDAEDEITLTLDPVGPYAIGDTEVTLTATDASGNVSTATAVVTVLPTAYSMKEEAIAILNGLVDPNDPNDASQLAINELTAGIDNGVFWAGPDRIAAGQGGANGADAFAVDVAAIDLLDAADPNQAAAIDLIVAANKIIMDVAIADAEFQGADVAEAKALRSEGCVANKQGLSSAAVAKYAEAWAKAAEGLKVPEPVVTEVPTLDYNEDGVVDNDDLFAFTEAILSVLAPEPEPEADADAEAVVDVVVE